MNLENPTGRARWLIWLRPIIAWLVMIGLTFASRQQNRRVLRLFEVVQPTSTVAALAITPTSDALLARASTLQLDNPCELGHAPSCGGAGGLKDSSSSAADAVRETEMVRALRARTDLSVAGEYLRLHKYKHSFRLLTDLLAHDQAAEVSRVLAVPEFQSENLPWYHAFASNAFLSPALTLIQARHYRAALEQYARFSTASLLAINHRVWMDDDDLDPADIAFLGKAFCDQPRPSERDECLLGLLTAVARADGGDGGGPSTSTAAPDYTFSRLFVPNVRIVAQAYRKLPAKLQQSSLRAYLEAMTAFYAERPASAVELLNALRRSDRRDAVMRLATYSMLRSRMEMARGVELRSCERERQAALALAEELSSRDSTKWFAPTVVDKTELIHDIVC